MGVSVILLYRQHYQHTPLRLSTVSPLLSQLSKEALSLNLQSGEARPTQQHSDDNTFHQTEDGYSDRLPLRSTGFVCKELQDDTRFCGHSSVRVRLLWSSGPLLQRGKQYEAI